MAGVKLILCPPAEAQQQSGGLEDVEQRPGGRVPEHHKASAVTNHDLTNEKPVLRVLTNERGVLRPGQAAEGWALQPPPRLGPPGDPQAHWRGAGPGDDNE